MPQPVVCAVVNEFRFKLESLQARPACVLAHQKVRESNSPVFFTDLVQNVPDLTSRGQRRPRELARKDRPAKDGPVNLQSRIHLERPAEYQCSKAVAKN